MQPRKGDECKSFPLEAEFISRESNFFRAAIAIRGYAPTSLLFVPLSGKVCARKHDLERKRREDNCWGERSSLVRGAKRTENNRPCKRMRGENMAAKTMKTMAKLIECGLRGEEGREREGGEKSTKSSSSDVMV